MGTWEQYQGCSIIWRLVHWSKTKTRFSVCKICQNHPRNVNKGFCPFWPSPNQVDRGQFSTGWACIYIYIYTRPGCTSDFWAPQAPASTLFTCLLALFDNYWTIARKVSITQGTSVVLETCKQRNNFGGGEKWNRSTLLENQFKLSVRQKTRVFYPGTFVNWLRNMPCRV